MSFQVGDIVLLDRHGGARELIGVIAEAKLLANNITIYLAVWEGSPDGFWFSEESISYAEYGPKRPDAFQAYEAMRMGE